jgi:uncharacterized repeat protein (TIGR01451 family)
MKIKILKISSLIFLFTIISGLFLAWPSFSLAQLPQDMPIMEMTQTVDKEQVWPGEILTYTIHCQNTGYWTAYDIEIEGSLPEGVSLESTSFPMSRFSGNKIEFELPDMAPGDGQTIFVKARVDEGVEGGTLLISNVLLSYGDGQTRDDPLVFARAQSVVGTQPVQVTAEVGSNAFMINLLLSLIAACLGMLVFCLVTKLNRQ